MSSSSKGVGGSGGSGYNNYIRDDDPPLERRSTRRRRDTNASQYGATLRPENMPGQRAPNVPSSTSTSRHRRSVAPQTVGGSSSSNSEMRARAEQYARHANGGRMTSRDAAIYTQIEEYRTSGQPPQNDVAHAIVALAGRYMPQLGRGPTADRTQAITDAMDDLLGEEMEAPASSTRTSRTSLSTRAPSSTVPPDAHHLVAGAIDNHFFGPGEADPATRLLIGEMMDLEMNGVRPPTGSPMRPIADMMHRGLSPNATQLDRQNVMFLALSETLGVHPDDVLGRPDASTGIPSNARYVMRETGVMADWMAEVAMRNADSVTRRAAQQINRFIETGEIPSGRMDDDTARIIESASRETSPNSTPGGSPRRSPSSQPGGGPRRTGGDRLATGAVGEDAPLARRNAVARGLLFVMNNEAQSTIGRGAFSTANSVARNVFTVMAPTMLRQYLDQGIASGTANWSVHHQEALALTAALIPPMLLGIGAYVDRDQATTASNVSRATLALVSLGSIATALGTGNMASLGPALMGFLAYAAMRDLGQKFIKLDNPDANPDMRVGTTAKGAGAYVANQTAASALMQYLASPSGAGAAGMPLQALNGFLRGVINMGAETGDDVTYNSFASREAGQSLRLTLSGAIPSPRELLSTYTTTSPSRATLSMVDAMLSTVVGAALAKTNLSDTTQTNLGNFFGAAVLGVLYTAFLHIHQGPPEAASVHDTESGRGPRLNLPDDDGSIAMSRLSMGDTIRTERSSRQGFTGNVGLGGGDRTPRYSQSREPSVMAMPPTPRERSRATSQASSMIGLPPSRNESRAPSIRDYGMLPPDPRDNPFMPLDQRDAYLAPPPVRRVRIRGSDTLQGPAPQRTPPRSIREPSIREPSIRSQDSNSDYQSFSTQDEFYTPRGSMHSRRNDDDDYDEYRR